MVLQHIGLLRQKRIVLASASPRRLEILRILGLDNVLVFPSNVAEDLPKADFKCGGDYALCTARLKAERAIKQQLEVRDNTGEEPRRDSGNRPSLDILIAADTVVTLPSVDGKRGIDIIEKAATAEEAAAMMRRLSGRRHDVWSGVVIAVVPPGSANSANDVHWHEMKVHTSVEFAMLSEDEITAYVANQNNWRGKAGAYGIQDTAACMIRSIEGDYYNVMGLPLHAVCAAFDTLISNGLIAPSGGRDDQV
ncbi:unnamed protein product [Trypanosoma congolense IL3000]|uniref:WGS project CAEQ00000000 data, annotated contig 1854 n=1 Tax=Trypanosoma congolense (strain IL3000) TaxID=1068625 RepID=F9W9E6_TRYCI|nr:unnamed protein product [Trypanosoma congolense IL3000]